MSDRTRTFTVSYQNIANIPKTDLGLKKTEILERAILGVWNVSEVEIRRSSSSTYEVRVSKKASAFWNVLEPAVEVAIARCCNTDRNKIFKDPEFIGI